jgi:hypothetical protein
MTRRHGVMAPPPHDGPPQRGLMAPGPAPTLDHSVAIPKLLWVVAAVLAAIEFALAAAPNA